MWVFPQVSAQLMSAFVFSQFRVLVMLLPGEFCNNITVFLTDSGAKLGWQPLSLQSVTTKRQCCASTSTKVGTWCKTLRSEGEMGPLGKRPKRVGVG